MKKLSVLLVGLGFATAAFPAVAGAAPFAPLNQRAQIIQMRIDQGIRSGAPDAAFASTPLSGGL